MFDARVSIARKFASIFKPVGEEKAHDWQIGSCFQRLSLLF